MIPYLVTGKIKWFSNTNGSDYTGLYNVYEQIAAKNKAAAYAGVMARLVERERWVEGEWLKGKEAEGI